MADPEMRVVALCRKPPPEDAVLRDYLVIQPGETKAARPDVKHMVPMCISAYGNLLLDHVRQMDHRSCVDLLSWTRI